VVGRRGLPPAVFVQERGRIPVSHSSSRVVIASEERSKSIQSMYLYYISSSPTLLQPPSTHD
jgi:hypothetical protein